MIPFNLGSSRPQYYDRNPSTKSIGVNQTLPPSIPGVILAAYTTPVNRVAMLTTCWIRITRSTAATAALFALLSAQHLISGVQVGTHGALTMNDNTVNRVFEVNFQIQSFLPSGETISLVYQDLSTGGTVTYSSFIEILEFDK